MIDFKPIEITDQKDIDSYLYDCNYRLCDFSFSNLFAWYPKFKTEFAIKNRTLFLKFEDAGQKFYLMPVGHMAFEQSFPLIMEDAEKNNSVFKMKAVTPEMWDAINKAIPNTFKYEHDRDNDEYIYLSEKLISLSGKKLQGKRNHINRFKADNPDWEYFPLLNQKDIHDCMVMLKKWDDIHEENDNSSRYDYIATRLMLEYFNCLPLKGAAVRVNGQIVAFTIGEKLTEDTFVIHVEKAFSNINGAYTIINQQFIEHEASEYKYINREEDMGIESLRKAKMSYRPEMLLQEGIVSKI